MLKEVFFSQMKFSSRNFSLKSSKNSHKTNQLILNIILPIYAGMLARSAFKNIANFTIKKLSLFIFISFQIVNHPAINTISSGDKCEKSLKNKRHD